MADTSSVRTRSRSTLAGLTAAACAIVILAPGFWVPIGGCVVIVILSTLIIRSELRDR